MKHIMLDLETMSTKPNAAIVAIGACEIFPEDKSERKTFYHVVDLQDSIDCKLQVDASTIYWWMNQSDEARKALQEEKLDLWEATATFQVWATEESEKWPNIWGNGASFDNVILRSTFDATLLTPWPYWQDRCYRTLKNLFPEIVLERKGTHHNALDDAISQAEHLEEIVRVTGLQLK